jgi:hypothetical protein
VWRRLGKRSSSEYDPTQLVDWRILEELNSRVQIICDIDKTYLETDFDSLVRLARIAFENASDKITVSGASETLTLARWGEPNPTSCSPEFPKPLSLHFVSSSPSQMRGVLEEKLAIDGLDWTSDTFKNQAYNLKKGRVDLLRQHIAYKTLAIMNILERSPAGSEFILIGDNAESDPFIYLGLSFLTEKRISIEEYSKYLGLGEVEPSICAMLGDRGTHLPSCRIRQIFIRNAPGYQIREHAPITSSLFRFDNFFQVALSLVFLKLIAPSNLWPLVRKFHNQHGMSLASIDGELKQFKQAQDFVGENSNGLPREVDIVRGRIGEFGGEADYSNLGAQNAGQDNHYLRLPQNANGLSAFAGVSSEEILKNAEIWLGME